MKILSYITIVLVFFCKVCFAQQVFQETISSPDTNLISLYSNVLALQDSGYLITCRLQTGITDTSKTFLLKINQNGTIAWQKQINNGGSSYLYYLNYANNGYLITGDAWDSSYHHNLLVLKVDFNGDTLWTRKYQDAGLGTYIKQMNNGDLLIVGQAAQPGQDQMVMRTDSLGNVIYNNVYATYLIGGVYGTSTSDEGVIFIEPKLTLVKTDAIGNITWTTPSSINLIHTTDVIETNDSCFIVLGYANNTNQIIFRKLNALGDTIWTRAISNFLESPCKSVKLLNDGGFITCGTTSNNGILASVLLIRTDSLASVLWSKTYITNIHAFDQGYNLAVTPDNGFVIFGISTDTLLNKNSILLIKTDSSGNTNCISYDANMVNVPVVTWADTVLNYSQTALTTTIVNSSIQYQNSNLYVSDSCIAITSINETIPSNLASFSIFPNPFTDVLNIKLSEGEITEVYLFDITSRNILRESFSYSISINTKHLANGLYFYEVKNKNGVIVKGKVIKD